MLKKIMRKIDQSLNEYADDESNMSSYLNDVKNYEFIVSKYGEFSGVRVWFAVGNLSIYLDTSTGEFNGALMEERVRCRTLNRVCEGINRIFKEIYKNEIQNKS